MSDDAEQKYDDGVVRDEPPEDSVTSHTDPQLEHEGEKQKQTRQEGAGSTPPTPPGRQDQEPEGGNWRRPLVVSVSILIALTAIMVVSGNSLRQRFFRPKPLFENFVITNQVIVSGPDAAVQAIINGLDDRRSALGASIPLGQELNDRQCPGILARDELKEDFVYALYSFTETENRTVVSVIRRIRELSASRPGVRVAANYVSGKPWEIEGSPWEIEGSSGASAGPGAQPSYLPIQEAFEIVSLDLVESPVGIQAEGEKEVRVGIFDTSPFTTSVGMTGTINVSWVNWPSDLELTVNNAVDPGPEPTPDLKDHGLFVSGLVNALAPSSDIRLIRVLKDDNTGDLFTLSRELFRFIQQVDRDGVRAVINLSLGIRVPPGNQRGFEELPRDIQLLQDVLALAECKGIVVVAAAGNESYEDVDNPKDASFPAYWPKVVGVAASNNGDERSCYSNIGDIGAPGGDGIDKPGDKCVPRLSDCDSPQCKYGVVGPVLKPDTTDTGFAYWVGSSFATPLVSGLAARILEADRSLETGKVREILMCGVKDGTGDIKFGAGVIDVNKTLGSQCMSQDTVAAE